jgi:hypothetical protein
MKKLTTTLIALFCTALIFAQSSKTSHTSTESTSVSINNSDHDYSVIAVFGEAKAAKVKAKLIEAIGKPNTENDGLALWNLKNIYTVTLKAEKLIIDLDKDKATGTLIKTFKNLGEDIQSTLGAAKTPDN